MRTLITMVRLALSVLVASAIGWQFRIHVANGFDPVNFFSYFTNLSNALAAAVFFAVALRSVGGKGSTPFVDRLRFASAVNMVIVGIVFALLLRDVDLGTLRPEINILLHYVMPSAALVDWLLDPPSTQLRRADLLRAEIFPLLYLTYTMIRGHFTGWYPYPFLTPANAGGYGGVGVYAIAIAVTFVVVGVCLMRTSRKRSSP